MCVLYVSFWSMGRPRTFGCVAMRSVQLFINNNPIDITSNLQMTQNYIIQLILIIIIII